MFSDEAEKLRWFLLPSEAQNNLRNPPKLSVQSPFYPISKPCILTHSQIEESIKIPDNIQQTANIKSKKSAVINETDKKAMDINNKNSSLKQHEQLKDKTDENQMCEMGSCFIKRREIQKSSISKIKRKFVCPPKSLMKPTITAIDQFEMIKDGDKVLVCLSGGKVGFCIVI